MHVCIYSIPYRYAIYIPLLIIYTHIITCTHIPAHTVLRSTDRIYIFLQVVKYLNSSNNQVVTSSPFSTCWFQGLAW